jgi:hypothetical protein
MEKLVYVLWRDVLVSQAVFEKRLLEEAPTRLAAAGARSVQVNLADDSVAPAWSLATQRNPKQPVAGLLQLWLDSAHERVRAPIDRLVQDYAGRVAGYLVSESVVHRTKRWAPVVGQRTPGWSLVSLIERPPRLTHDAWLDVWQRFHVPVAIATQSIHRRAENLVIRALTPGAPAYDAFVEESFPDGAMDNPSIFFAAPGDPDREAANSDMIMASCAGFLDFDRLDVVPMSHHTLGPGWEGGP